MWSKGKKSKLHGNVSLAHTLSLWSLFMDRDVIVLSIGVLLKNDAVWSEAAAAPCCTVPLCTVGLIAMG